MSVIFLNNYTSVNSYSLTLSSPRKGAGGGGGGDSPTKGFFIITLEQFRIQSPNYVTFLKFYRQSL